MKTSKLSFDFSDHPELVELLRFEAVARKQSQKAILVEALKAYFSEKLETALVYRVAEKAFSEWNNDEDSVYDKL